MVPKILTFGAGQNGKKFSIWFRFYDIWCTLLQMVTFYIWRRNKRRRSSDRYDNFLEIATFYFLHGKVVNNSFM